MCLSVTKWGRFPQDEILAIKINDYSNLEIEGDSKIVIDSFNKMISIPYSIILINGRYLEDVSRAKCVSLLSLSKKANRIVDCLAKKD